MELSLDRAPKARYRSAIWTEATSELESFAHDGTMSTSRTWLMAAKRLSKSAMLRKKISSKQASLELTNSLSLLDFWR